MKKLLVVVGLFCAIAAQGQSYREVVTLKNGSVIRGEIIEQVPGQSLKVMTRDGSVIVCQMDEVERIGKEERRSEAAENAKYSGFVFSGIAGYDINTKGGGGSIVAEAELGKRFTPNFYWGAGVGAMFSSSGVGLTVPLSTNLKTYMPMQNSNVVPFSMLKVGCMLNHDVSSVMLQIMPGVQFPLQNTIDMNLGLGYTHAIYKGGSGGAVSIRMGFQFHNSATRQHTVRQRKILPGSASNVFQATVEGGAQFPKGDYFQYGLNVVATYKQSPTLMGGVGIGMGTTELNTDGDYIHHTDAFSANYKQLFARGLYRLSDKRFSPFVMCDVGLRHHSITTDAFKQYLDRVDEGKSFGALFVNPGIGFSMRTSQNSYFDVTASYYLSGKKSFNGKDVSTKGMSGLLLKAGFTRTLNWFE